ncbi:hypothetical protein Nmel_005125 [Mimus melanotis]
MTNLWDEVGVKLWNVAAKGEKVAADMLPSWRVVFEVLKGQEKSHAKDKGDGPCHPSMAEAQSSSQSGQETLFHPSLTARKKERRIPLILGQLILITSQIYFPPDPKDNWVRLKQQALREDDLDIAERIVAPVIYLGMRK